MQKKLLLSALLLFSCLFALPSFADQLYIDTIATGSSFDTPAYPTFLTLDTLTMNTSGTITRIFPAMRFCSGGGTMGVSVDGFEGNFSIPQGTAYREMNIGLLNNIQFNTSDSVVLKLSEVSSGYGDCDIQAGTSASYGYQLYYCPTTYDPATEELNQTTCVVTSLVLPPVVNLSEPSGSYSALTVPLKFNVITLGTLDTCKYSLDGGANVTVSLCANTTITTTEASHTITLYVNDTLGQSGLDSSSFSITLPPPPPTQLSIIILLFPLLMALFVVFLIFKGIQERNMTFKEIASLFGMILIAIILIVVVFALAS